MGSQCSFIPAMRLNAQPQLKDDAGYTYRKGSKGKDGMYFFNSVWAHGTDIPDSYPERTVDPVFKPGIGANNAVNLPY